jgi:hypothetical protein
MKLSSRNFWPQVASIALTCLTLPAAIAAYLESGMRAGMPLAVLSCCTATAAWMRLGWTTPGIILGAAVGQLLDPAVKSGELYYQRMETVEYVATGAVTGLFVGFVLDTIAWTARPRPIKNASTSESPPNEVP